SAVKDCDKAEDLRFRGKELYLIRGAAKAGTGEHRQAIADYSRIILLDPSDNEAILQRGISLMELGKEDSALADFEFVIRNDSSNAMGYFYRASLQAKKMEYKKALSDLNASIDL